MSYADFLVKMAGCDAGVPPFFQARPHSLYGLGIDAVSALDSWGIGLPGFAGMRLEPTAGPGMGLDARPGRRSPFLHFPDGNATIARLSSGDSSRTRSPAGRPTTWCCRASSTRLDEPGPARLRLNSTAVRPRHTSQSTDVEVDYVRSGRFEQVRA
jgi:hypothetical protein